MITWRPTKAAVLIMWAHKQVGKPYVLGAEAKLTAKTLGDFDAFDGQVAFDCSEFVQTGLWVADIEIVTDSRGRRMPVPEFDGAWKQWERSRSIPFKAGVKTPGALLFVKSATAYSAKPYNIGHVAISLGNGYIVEARGRAYGVTIGPVRSSFNLATKVDQLYVPVVIGKG